MTTTPIPIGPGFPEQAPSVHSSSAGPPCRRRSTAPGAAALRRALAGGPCSRLTDGLARRRPRRASGFRAEDGSSCCRFRDTSSRRGRCRIQDRLSRLVGAHPDPLSFEPHANPGHPPHYDPTALVAPAARRARGAVFLPRRLPARSGAERALTVQGRLALFPAAGARGRRRRRRAAARQPGRRQGRRRWRTNRRPTRTRSPSSSAAPASIRSSRSPASPSPSPRTRARSGDFGLVLRAEKLRRDAPGRLRARRAAEDRRRSGRHQARPPDALVVEAGSDRRRLLHRRPDLRARRGRLGRAHGRSGRQDRAPGDSAATNLELVRLVERAAGTHAIWGAAIVPAETARARWPRSRASPTAATINTLSAAIDFGKGLEAT